MTRRQGSVLLYVLAMVIAVGAISIAVVNVCAAGYTAQIRAERAVIADDAFDGAVDQIVEDSALGTLTIPSTRNLTVGQAACTINVSDNGATLPGSYLVTGTMVVKGLTFNRSRVIGRRIAPDPFFYVLFSNATVNSNQAVVTNGPSWAGDVSVNGNLTLSSASTQINGDAEATGTISPSSLAVTGVKLEGASPVTFTALPFFLIPALNPYLVQAVLQLPGLLINGLSLGNGYPLAYALLATQLKGTFTGKGTIYFPGNVTIVGDMFYGDSDSRIAVIAYGNITVSGSVSHLVGYFYAGGTFTVQSPTAKLLDTGCVVANSVVIQAPFTLNHDAAVWQDPTEGFRLKLPGYWP